MSATMKFFRLSTVLLASALALSGCGRKNLPVAPTPVTAPIGGSKTPNSGDNAPSSTANFQRSARIGAGSNLNVSPAEVTRNPKAERKTFPLDFLLN